MGVSWTATMDQKLLLVILSIVKLDAGAIAAKWLEENGANGGEQPTKRAITEHIVKLKKSLGVTSGKPNGGNSTKSAQHKSIKSPMKKKAKLMPSPPGDLDDPELSPSSIKEEDEPTEPHTPPPSGGSRSPTLGRTLFDPPIQGKRKRCGESDEEEESEEEGSIKSGASSEYRGRNFVAPESPVRVMQPRRAKTERPAIVDEDSSEEEEEAEQEEAGDEEGAEGGEFDEAAIDPALRVPSPPVLEEAVIVAQPENLCIAV